VVGIALFVGGAVSFIGGFDREPSFPHFPDGSFGGRRGSPSSDDGNKFWMCFVGVPVLGIGAFLTKAGYFGAAARYIASESRPAVHTITRAVAEGLRGDDGDAVGTDGRGGVAAGGEAARRRARSRVRPATRKTTPMPASAMPADRRSPAPAPNAATSRTRTRGSATSAGRRSRNPLA